MKNYPNIQELIRCIKVLAFNMDIKPLPDEIIEKLINHVLFQGMFEGMDGKDGWSCLISNLVTERELRNLLIAHSATKLANYNDVSEPSFNSYDSTKICEEFERALFGRLAKL